MVIANESNSLNKSDSIHDTEEARVFREQLEKIINARPIISVQKYNKKTVLIEKEYVVESICIKNRDTGMAKLRGGRRG